MTLEKHAGPFPAKKMIPYPRFVQNTSLSARFNEHIDISKGKKREKRWWWCGRTGLVATEARWRRVSGKRRGT